MPDIKVSALPAQSDALVAADELVVLDVSTNAVKRATVTQVATAVTSVGALATDAELAAHVDDTTDAHDASAISFAATGTIAATDVQTAVAEVATDAAAALAAHEADTTNVHGIADTSALATSAAVAAGYQPLDSDLTAIAALSTTSYGRAFLTLANQAATMALLSAASDTASGIVELATTAETTTGTDTTRAVTPAGVKAVADTLQPLDSDLTAIAALSTTSFGRALLALADAVALRTAAGAAAATDLSTHTGLTTGAHGVTRTMVPFTSTTPVQVPANLLTLDEQRFISGWTAGAGATSLTLNVAGGADGGGTATVVCNAASGDLCYSVAEPVTAGTAYTASMRASLNGTVGLRIDWYNDAGGTVPNATPSNSGPTVASGSTTVTISVTATAPTSAVSARVVLVYSSSAATRVCNPSVACIRTSATIPGSSGVTGWSAVGCALRVGADGRLVATADGTGSPYFLQTFTLGNDSFVRVTAAIHTPAYAAELHLFSLWGSGSPVGSRRVRDQVPANAYASTLQIAAPAPAAAGPQSVLMLMVSPANGAEVIVSPLYVEEIAA